MLFNILPLIITFNFAIGLSVVATVSNAEGNSQSLGPIIAPAENGGFKPQIVMHCGHFNQYLDRTGVWLSDSKVSCLSKDTQIIDYCRSVYPTLNITNIMEMGAVRRIDNWCSPDQNKCQDVFDVKPYWCIDGSHFQSEALLVPDGCAFDHIHAPLCQTQEYWYIKAGQACDIKMVSSNPTTLVGGDINTNDIHSTVVNDVKAYDIPNSPYLHSYSMLLPCNIGKFAGIEFVCCNTKNMQSSIVSVKKEPPTKLSLANDFVNRLFIVDNDGEKSKLNQLSTLDNINQTKEPSLTAGLGAGHKVVFASQNTGPQSIDPSPLIDNQAKVVTTPTITDPAVLAKNIAMREAAPSVTLATENSLKANITKLQLSEETLLMNKNDSIQSADSRIKAYYETFDKAHEHDRYADAKASMKEKRRKTILNLMKEWTLSEKRFHDIAAKDPYLAQNYKRDITKSFQKTIEALEAEENAQKKQLTAIHEQRVTSLLNARKRTYMFEFLKELEQSHPTPETLKQNLEELLRAEERDKMHVVHYYEHLLNSDPALAKRVRGVVIKHIQDVERRMNRSLSMLKHRISPQQFEMISPHIESFLATIKTRNGDFPELIQSIIQDDKDLTDIETVIKSSQQKIKNGSVKNYESNILSTKNPKQTTEESDDDDVDDTDDLDDDLDDLNDNEQADDDIDYDNGGAQNHQNISASIFPKTNFTVLNKNQLNNKNKTTFEQFLSSRTNNMGKQQNMDKLLSQANDILPYNQEKSVFNNPPYYHGTPQEVIERHDKDKHAGKSIEFLIMATAFIVVAVASIIGFVGYHVYAKRNGIRRGGKNMPDVRHTPLPTKEQQIYNATGMNDDGVEILSGPNCEGNSLRSPYRNTCGRVANAYLTRNSIFRKNLAAYYAKASVSASAKNFKKPQIDKECNVSMCPNLDERSLEEKHLSSMQVNGYENPTYRYFEKMVQNQKE